MKYSIFIVMLALIITALKLYCHADDESNTVWIRNPYVVNATKILDYAEQRLKDTIDRIDQIWDVGPDFTETQKIELWYSHGRKSELETLLVLFKRNDYIDEYGVIYE